MGRLTFAPSQLEITDDTLDAIFGIHANGSLSAASTHKRTVSLAPRP